MRNDLGVVLVFGLLLCSACAGGEGTEKGNSMFGSKTVPFEVIVPTGYGEGVQPGNEIYGSEAGKPSLLWFRTLEGWRRAGFKAVQGASEDPGDGEGGPGLEPDFGKYDVLLLSLGMQPTTGYRLIFERVEMKGKAARLKVKFLPPSGPAGEAMTRLSGMVRLAKLPADARVLLEVNGKDTPFTLKTVD